VCECVCVSARQPICKAGLMYAARVVVCAHELGSPFGVSKLNINCLACDCVCVRVCMCV